MIQESPTLDLADDCSRFVTRHFEVISASSPHIYHSALVLTPRESIVRELYKSHAQHFVKVVHGMPALWDSNVAATTSRFKIRLAVWSPCNGFIAITTNHRMSVSILDSVTLQRYQTLEFPREISRSSEALAFSPDSHILTSISPENYYLHKGGEGAIVSWDLQTGGVVSSIELKGHHDIRMGNAHITHSMNGKMVAVLYRYRSSTVISIYDVVSGLYMYDIDHRVNLGHTLGTPSMDQIWTHGESLRFAIPGVTAITILEVGFALGATPIEVETVSVSDNIVEPLVLGSKEQDHITWTEFHPASCRLAFIKTGGTLLVWDSRASKYLLHHTHTNFHDRSMTFSSNGCLFACTTIESEVYIWRELPTGYILSEKLTPNTRYPKPRPSPNGESIITFKNYTIQLWHANGFATTTSRVSNKPLQHTGEDFILEFFPDRPLVVAARKKDKTVVVLDLKSGVLQLAINTSIEVYGLRSIGDTIVVIGDEKAITWDLPGGNFPPDAKMNVEDCTQTISFGKVDDSTVIAASISLDLRYIALIRYRYVGFRDCFLDVCCPSVGRNFRVETQASALWFAPGGNNIWCATNVGAEVYTITEDAVVHTKTIAHIEYGSWGCPWRSSCGHKGTNAGWILGREGKRLVMLPPIWRSYQVLWHGKFLALLHGGLSELIILEMEL